MGMISPMPSPRGTNREQLYILRGGARRSSPKGAYDAKGGPRLAYDEVDSVKQLHAWIVENLDDAAQARLVQALADTRRGAQDEEAAPSLNPNATRHGVNATQQRKAALTAQDARFGAVLKKAFARPGSAAFDARQRRKLAADSAIIKSLAERYPGFGKIDVAALFTDPMARRVVATDAAQLKSIEERYPDIAKIGFA
jgi:hypothetical protein